MINPIARTLERAPTADQQGYSIPCIPITLPQISLIDSESMESLSMEDGDCIMILNIAQEYPRYLKVFSEEQANRMPPHRQWDHEIVLKEGAKIPNGIIYKKKRRRFGDIGDTYEKCYLQARSGESRSVTAV